MAEKDKHERGHGSSSEQGATGSRDAANAPMIQNSGHTDTIKIIKASPAEETTHATDTEIKVPNEPLTPGMLNRAGQT